MLASLVDNRCTQDIVSWHDRIDQNVQISMLIHAFFDYINHNILEYRKKQERLLPILIKSIAFEKED